MRLDRVMVNPRRNDKGPLTVLNIHGQQIKESEKGTPVPKTSFYNRMIKDGDLIPVTEKRKLNVKKPSTATVEE